MLMLGPHVAEIAHRLVDTPEAIEIDWRARWPKQSKIASPRKKRIGSPRTKRTCSFLGNWRCRSPQATRRPRPNLEAVSPDPRLRVPKRKPTKRRINLRVDRSSAIDHEYDGALGDPEPRAASAGLVPPHQGDPPPRGRPSPTNPGAPLQ